VVLQCEFLLSLNNKELQMCLSWKAFSVVHKGSTNKKLRIVYERINTMCGPLRKQQVFVQIKKRFDIFQQFFLVQN